MHLSVCAVRLASSGVGGDITDIMTRFDSAIRKHFTIHKKDKKNRAQCNYCGNEIDDNATRLRFHIFGGMLLTVASGQCHEHRLYGQVSRWKIEQGTHDQATPQVVD